MEEHMEPRLSKIMTVVDWVVLVLAIVFCVSASVYYVVRRLTKRRIHLKLHTGRVLFVVAHPDDECMFFAPTILTLTRSGQYDVFLLCLSSGNFYSQGRVRQQELMVSCATLGIRQSNVFVLDHREIVDDPSVVWSRDLVAKLIGEYVRNYLVDIIFTFDEYGVSGHLNHSSLYHGVSLGLKNLVLSTSLLYVQDAVPKMFHSLLLKLIVQFLSSRECPPGVHGYELESVCRLRKYSSFVELAWSFVTSRLLFVSGSSELVKAQSAMYAHRSQFVWFRLLYIIFSRYMITNTYRPIQPTS